MHLLASHKRYTNIFQYFKKPEYLQNLVTILLDALQIEVFSKHSNWSLIYWQKCACSDWWILGHFCLLLAKNESFTNYQKMWIKMLNTEHFLNVLSALPLYENGVIIHESLCYKLSYSGATIVSRWKVTNRIHDFTRYSSLTLGKCNYENVLRFVK